MPFENKKITLLITSIFYGLFLLLGIGGFVYAALNPEFIKGNDDVSVLFVSSLIIGLQYFLYLKNEVIQNVTFSDILGVLSKILIYGLSLLMFLYITNQQNACQYIDIYCGSLMATAFGLSLHDSYHDWSSRNSGYFTTFILTILGLVIGMILYRFLNIVVLYMIIGSCFIFHTIYISSFGDSSFNFVLSLGTSIVFFISSIACGIANNASLMYLENPVNGLIFLPIIFMLYYFITFVCVQSKGVKDEKVLKLLYPISATSLIVLQYIMILKWVIGIALLIVLIITTIILCNKYATESHSYESSYNNSSGSSTKSSTTYSSSGYEDYDFEDMIKREIDSHISSWDSSIVSTRRSGSSLIVNITITMSSRDDYNYYHNNISYWVNPYKSYTSRLANNTTHISFNINYRDEH